MAGLETKIRTVLSRNVLPRLERPFFVELLAEQLERRPRSPSRAVELHVLRRWDEARSTKGAR